jgi:hypothetical protein
MASLTFRFSVDDQGAFTYEKFTHPETGVTTTNWPYSGVDTVRFESEKGPFTLMQRRTDTAAPGWKDPFNGPVKATKEGNVWVATVTVNDGLTPAFRKQLFQSQGFISKYRYVIGLQNGAEIAVDDNHPGIHTC